MKIIQRPLYLNKLISVVGTPEIKVIMGIRRCGKSKLLESFIEWIKQSDPEANIINIKLSDTATEVLREYHSLLYYVQSNYKEGVRNFVIIDEVQRCSGFEEAINSLHSQEKWDIYITGSNAFLMSSDLATLFTGRVFEIQVFPFSFSEFQTYYNISILDAAFEKYIAEGGMSGSYNYTNIEEKYDYVENVYSTLITIDIVQKNGIKHAETLERVAEFLIDNSSCETSSRSVANYINSNYGTITHVTVSDYMKFLCNAFLFYKIRRYDVSGKKYLIGQEKYYLADHSFRYSILGVKNLNRGRMLENIVAIELLRRGYDVYTGVLRGKEIDFVALKRNEKIYIQVADNIDSEDTKNRECEPLLKIKDAYPKIILANTKCAQYDKDGIQIINLASWLLEG